MAETQRYYWLKLKRDFFKRHDIRIIEEMENGKDYILFYLKLLCESVDHDGLLRFSEQVPYNEKMLSTITNTNVDIVRSAIKAFTELKMMEILDDGTIYMNEVQKMIGGETQWAEKKRQYRASLGQCPQDVLALSDKSKSKSIEKDIDIEKEIDIKKETNTKVFVEKESQPTKRFVKPTVEEIRAYCQERHNNIDPENFFNYYESKGWVVGKSPMKDWKAAVRTWEKMEQERKKNKVDPRYQNPWADDEEYKDLPF